MDRQAAENAKSGTTRGFMIGLGVVALVGIAFGGYHAFNFFTNFETNTYKRNVAVTLKDPKVVSGKAQVSVEIKNHNAVDISTPIIHYSIASKENQPLANGEVKLEGSIPAADGREFQNVTLAEVSGQPARMKSDLVSIQVVENAKLPKGFSARFAGAFEKNGNERIAALTPMATEVPGFDGGYIGIGMTYQDNEDWQHALEQYKKAVEVAPESFNAHYHLGVAQAHEKQMPEAIASLKKAAELKPGDETITKALAALEKPTP